MMSQDPPRQADQDSRKAKDADSKLMLQDALTDLQDGCLPPDFAEAHFNLGEFLRSQHRPEEAKRCYQQALIIKPGFAEARDRLGEVLRLLARDSIGRREGVDTTAEPLPQIQQRKAQELCDKAALCQAQGKGDEAMDCYRQAVAVKPDFAKAHGNLGNLLMSKGRLEEALVCYQNVLAIDPGSFVAYNNMGNALRLQNRWQEAVDSYRQAVQLNRDYVEVHVNLGTILMEQGQLDEALERFRYALTLDPGHVRAAAGVARVYESLGDFETAYAGLQPFLASGKENVDVALAFAALCRHIHRCDEAIAMMERLLGPSAPPIGVYERVLLHFDLGRLLDAAAEYDRAFAHYSQGNALKINQTKRFDPKKHAADVDKIIEAYSAEFMSGAPHATNASQLPIFIVGMPRSGTSLVEQILASHPQVFGGGELADMSRIADSLPGVLGTQLPYPQCIAAITSERCDILSQRYLERLRMLSQDADRVTDKMPSNFFHLGLIALLFPKARVIHCVRDPLDTCLSCYFQNFAQGNSYSLDLRYLGGYYRQYQRLMNHWTAVLDVPMMEVRYEELIANQETLSREMIEFCGLSWDEQCLKFYQTARVVATASYDQVRRPLYRKSSGRWKNYERHLGPLKEALARD